MKLIRLSDLDALDILEAESKRGEQSLYPSIFRQMWFQRDENDPPTRVAPSDYLFSTMGFVFSARGVDVSKSPRQLVAEKYDPRLIISDLIGAGADVAAVADVFLLTGLPTSFLLDNVDSLIPSISGIGGYLAAIHAIKGKEHVDNMLHLLDR